MFKFIFKILGLIISIPLTLLAGFYELRDAIEDAIPYKKQISSIFAPLLASSLFAIVLTLITQSMEMMYLTIPGFFITYFFFKDGDYFQYESEEDIEQGFENANKEFIERGKKDVLFFESFADFKLKLQNLLFEVNESSSKSLLDKNLLNLKNFIFDISRCSELKPHLDLNSFIQESEEDPYYSSGIGLIFYYLHLYETENGFNENMISYYDELDLFSSAISYFLYTSKKGNKLSKNFLKKSNERIKKFDISIPKDIYNELIEELGLEDGF